MKKIDVAPGTQDWVLTHGNNPCIWTAIYSFAQEIAEVFATHQMSQLRQLFWVDEWIQDISKTQVVGAAVDEYKVHAFSLVIEIAYLLKNSWIGLWHFTEDVARKRIECGLETLPDDRTRMSQHRYFCLRCAQSVPYEGGHLLSRR